MDLAALESEEGRICEAPSGNGEEACRRMWRIVGLMTELFHLLFFPLDVSRLDLGWGASGERYLVADLIPYF